MSSYLTLDNMKSFVICSQGILKYSYSAEIIEFLLLLSVAESTSQWSTRKKMLQKCQEIGVCDGATENTPEAWEKRFNVIRKHAKTKTENVTNSRLSPPTIDLLLQHIDLIESCTLKTLRYRTVSIFTILMVVVMVLIVSSVFVHPNMTMTMSLNKIYQ